MTTRVPEAILKQHIAILGKTGSGKTSTGKLLVERVVDEGSRVCILDPIKSDWWGLISSANGKHPGLPFQILGGPHGHVPLHDGAGAAIGELVASGALPLSIIDMADFGAGGAVRFFSQFAHVLLRKMRGVLYLVMEEAHEFAPKERSGIGQETMSVYYAKKIATAGRSKGVRMMVCTQRVQSLHNALLGSCETMMVHRMTAPADQEPVENWLRKNIKDKARRAQIEESIPGLKTGSAWVCSGEAGLLELVQFPKFSTFDNSKAPTDDENVQDVVQARIDEGKLRALIGTAVTEAEANDPKLLHEQIQKLQRELELRKQATGEPVDSDAIYKAGYDTGYGHGSGRPISRAKAYAELVGRWNESCKESVRDALERIDAAISACPVFIDIEPIKDRAIAASEMLATAPRSVSIGADLETGMPAISDNSGGAKRRIMIALAQSQYPLSPRKISILADVKEGGSTWRGAFAALRRDSRVNDVGGAYAITSAGRRALGEYIPLPTGKALRDHWQAKIGTGTRGQIFAEIVAAYPKAIAAELVARRTSVELGGSTWRGHLAYLRGLELVSGSAELTASADLF